jgi:hypothetical protein
MTGNQWVAGRGISQSLRPLGGSIPLAPEGASPLGAFLWPSCL